MLFTIIPQTDVRLQGQLGWMQATLHPCCFQHEQHAKRPSLGAQHRLATPLSGSRLSTRLLSLRAWRLADPSVANGPARQIPVATAAVPVPWAESKVPRLLAPPTVAVAKASSPPVVVVADAAPPVACLPLLPWHPRLSPVFPWHFDSSRPTWLFSGRLGGLRRLQRRHRRLRLL